MREWLISHPQVVGVVVAACAAWVALSAFDAGRAIGAAGGLDADLGRLRSEALGG